MQKIRNFVRDNKGATAIEYGLIAALIAVAAIATMTQLGSRLNDTFGAVNSGMKAGTVAPTTKGT